MKKRLLSIILSFMMVVTMLPMSTFDALAAGDTTTFTYTSHPNNYIDIIFLTRQSDGKYTVAIECDNLYANISDPTLLIDGDIYWYITDDLGYRVTNNSHIEIGASLPVSVEDSWTNVNLVPGNTYYVYCMGAEGGGGPIAQEDYVEFTVPALPVTGSYTQQPADVNVYVGEDANYSFTFSGDVNTKYNSTLMYLNGASWLDFNTIDPTSDVQYTGTISAESEPCTKTFKASIYSNGEWVDSDEFTVTWSTKVFNATFDANGGTGTMSTFTQDFSGQFMESFTFPSCTFKAPAGKRFDQWEWNYVGQTETYTTTVGSRPWFVDSIEIRPVWVDKEPNPYTIINKIEINDFPEELDDEMTGDSASFYIKSEYTYPDDVNYRRGNDNVNIKQNDEFVYTSKLVKGLPTLVRVEVYANTDCDFDHYDFGDIEVWINGVKRSDVIVDDYNDYWHSVDVYIPVTVKEFEGVKHTLTFNTKGGSTIESQLVGHDTLAIEPEKPTYEGKVFVGWFKDEACTNPFYFNTSTVTEDTTLYAKWEEKIVAKNIKKIEIVNFHSDLNDLMTGNDAMEYIGYMKGVKPDSNYTLNSVWIKQDGVNVYSDNLVAGKNTEILMDVMANPYQMDHENPPYDFDRNHLDEIEVWVNGVKRSDAKVQDYNEHWRSVYVSIPVTVEVGTLPSAVSYYVTFEANGGTGEMATKAVPIDRPTIATTFAFPSCDFIAPEGLMFDHWSWKYEGKDQEFEALPGHNNWLSGDITVKPVWTCIGEHTGIKKTVTKATLTKNGKIKTECTACGMTTEEIIYYPKTFKLSSTTPAYTGSTIKPTVTVVDSEGNTIASKNYTVSYLNAAGKTTTPKAVGKYTVKVTMKGNYSGTKSVTYKIVPKKTTIGTPVIASDGITVKWTKNTSGTGYYIYRSVNGGSYTNVKKITSNTTVSWKDTGAKTNGAKYQYKIIAYKTVSGTTYKSADSSVKTIYFMSRPTVSSLTNSAKGTMLVKWNKNSKANGYQIQYSTSSSFSSPKSITIEDNTIVSKKITGRTKGKTYYVRMRSYKTVDGKNYYSAWSASKSVKITK